jgi:hypothetical protein
MDLFFYEVRRFYDWIYEGCNVIYFGLIFLEGYEEVDDVVIGLMT